MTWWKRKPACPAGWDWGELSGPADTVIWLVGDIHGSADLLQSLTRVVLADLRRCPGARRVAVFLGDYVDRGPKSRAVIDHLLECRERLLADGGEFRALRGNHEELLLRFLDDPGLGPQWAAVGGKDTLASYGVAPPAGDANEQEWRDAARRLAENLPPSHLDFLRRLETSVSIGDFHVVHAGVRPGVPLEQQADEDVVWIRDAFLLDRDPFSKMIIHGHTHVPDLHVDHRRICIDTGAYATGVLTGMRIQGRVYLVMQTKRDWDRVDLTVRPLEPARPVPSRTLPRTLWGMRP